MYRFAQAMNLIDDVIWNRPDVVLCRQSISLEESAVVYETRRGCDCDSDRLHSLIVLTPCKRSVTDPVCIRGVHGNANSRSHGIPMGIGVVLGY